MTRQARLFFNEGVHAMALHPLVHRDARIRSSFRLRRIPIRSRSRRPKYADTQAISKTELPANQVARAAWVKLGGHQRHAIRCSCNATLHRAAATYRQQCVSWCTRLRLSPRGAMNTVLIGFAFFIAVSDGFSLSLVSPKATASVQVPASIDHADSEKPRIPFPNPVSSATRRDPRVDGVDNGPRLVTPTQESGPMFVDAYVIQPHDTLRAIATRYGLRVESLVGSNTLGAWIAIGDTIRIPRRDGVVHTVAVEETLNQIAQAYQVDAAMIRTYAPNQLDRGQALRPGQELFIPEALIPVDRWPHRDLADRAATPMVVVQRDARLWSGPGTVYTRSATVQRGVQLRVVAQHDGWLQVQADVGIVWIEQQQIQGSVGAIESVPEATDLPPAPPTWFWPTIGAVSSPFGQRALTVNGATFHNGIDIANREGTPIYAIRRGTVIEAGWCRGFGYCVKLQHDDGFASTYGHMMSQPPVVAGQWVDGGEPIGLMGTTYDAAGGGYSTGPHLHLTLKADGQAVDPLRWLPSSR